MYAYSYICTQIYMHILLNKITVRIQNGRITKIKVQAVQINCLQIELIDKIPWLG